MKTGFLLRKTRRGSALLAVFWVMAVLGLAIVASLRVVGYQVEVVDAQVSGVEARQYAEMGIAVAANPKVPVYDPLLHVDFENDSGFDVEIISEAARFNINYILFQDDRRLLRTIFTRWGLAFEDAQLVADSLVDWIDSDDKASLNGTESRWYENQGLLNRPYNRAFHNLDEIRLVRGMDLVEGVKPDWRDWFTVLSSGGLDVNAAAPELLAAAVEGNIEDAESFKELVKGPDGLERTEDDQPFPDLELALSELGVSPGEQDLIARRFLNGTETATRIESVGYTGDVKRKIILVLQNRTGNPAILERSEELVRE